LKYNKDFFSIALIEYYTESRIWDRNEELASRLTEVLMKQVAISYVSYRWRKHASTCIVRAYCVHSLKAWNQPAAQHLQINWARTNVEEWYEAMHGIDVRTYVRTYMVQHSEMGVNSWSNRVY